MSALKKDWFVYILRCADGSLYTGVTNNIERRFGMHNAGTASKYTRTRLPVVLVYQENNKTRAQALSRECVIKGFPKDKKERLCDDARFSKVKE